LSHENWFKVVKNGVVYWESETYRSEQKQLAEQRRARAEIRMSTGFKEHAIEENADRLMALLESFYPFGDADFNPQSVFLKAEMTYGYEADYLKLLISNLVQRKVVRFEYISDPDVDPRDALDYWRLHKIET